MFVVGAAGAEYTGELALATGAAGSYCGATAGLSAAARAAAAASSRAVSLMVESGTGRNIIRALFLFVVYETHFIAARYHLIPRMLADTYFMTYHDTLL